VVWGYSGVKNKKGGQGDVLIPFPGRVADGRYSFEGRTHQLERNDKEGPNAIHGFVRSLQWTVVSKGASNWVEFEVMLEAQQYASRGYPFSLSVRVTYHLGPGGLSCTFAVQNVGTSLVPLGVGFHPYFTVGTATIDEAEACIAAAGYLEFNERLTPTGRIVPASGTEWDYRQFRPVGAQRFNHCYVHLERDPNGSCTASLRNPHTGRTIDVVMDRSFDAIVVYTGDAIAEAPRRALAIEPMTCASDAFNYPDWGLKRLMPGATFSGRYGISAR
jgi:aldose 1-epimerase